MSDLKEQVQLGLDKMRVHIDEMRVKASLLKLEVRDRSGPVVDDIEKAYDVTKEKLVEFGNATGDKADAAAVSLKSAWENLKAKIHAATAPGDE